MPIKDPEIYIAPIVILSIITWIIFYYLSTMSLRKIKKIDSRLYQKILRDKNESWIDRPGFQTFWSDTSVVYRLNKTLLGHGYDGPIFIKPTWLTPLVGIISLSLFIVFIFISLEVVILGTGK